MKITTGRAEVTTPIKTTFGNPRYQIFFDTFGAQEGYSYVLFIQKMIKLYTGSIYGKIQDHEEFTRFIAQNANKVTLSQIA